MIKGVTERGVFLDYPHFGECPPSYRSMLYVRVRLDSGITQMLSLNDSGIVPYDSVTRPGLTDWNSVFVTVRRGKEGLLKIRQDLKAWQPFSPRFKFDDVPENIEYD